MSTTTALRHTIDTELGVTQRTDRGDVVLVIHRTSCKLKAPRTPLALVSTQQRWAEAKPCTTCQPSARQLTELHAYIADRIELERGASDVVIPEPCSDDARALALVTGSRAATVRHEHRDPTTGEIVVDSVQTWERGDEIGTFLSTAAPKRVREIAQGADVVPLTKRGKHNVRRNARHDQRTPVANVEQQRDAQDAPQPTKRCTDCAKDVKLTSFPTSTKGGQVVRLDYCRPCRSIRAAAKGGK